jgi:ribosome-associated protein
LLSKKGRSPDLMTYPGHAMADEIVIAPNRVLPSESLTIKSARASGPGGQHVNRTETKIQITFDPRLVPWIDEGTRLRIVALAGRNVDSDGCVHVASQEYRDKERNLDDAREKLAELVKKSLVRKKKRIATKPSRAQKQRRLDNKKQTARKKEGRSRVRDD